MMIYLSGAQNSLDKSPNNPQSDPSKSLGGFISSSIVPNGSLNSLFDLISSYTINQSKKETIAIGLINQTEKSVNNLSFKIITDEFHNANFELSIVKLNKDLSMEKINNRFQEPIIADFSNADFYRTSVQLKISNVGAPGDEIILYPFNVVININGSDLNSLWDSFEEAFYDEEDYSVKRVKEDTFLIVSKDDTVLESPVTCSYISTGSFSAEFLDKFSNKKNNELLLQDVLLPNQGLGIWIKRTIKKTNNTDEELINEYDQKYEKSTEEEVELAIGYEMQEQNNYNEEYDEEYS